MSSSSYRSFACGSKSIEIAAGAQVILTTDPNMADKGTAEKVSTCVLSLPCPSTRCAFPPANQLHAVYVYTNGNRFMWIIQAWERQSSKEVTSYW